jgi:tetratricopeptide (TPR) repeat protein
VLRDSSRVNRSSLWVAVALCGLSAPTAAQGQTSPRDARETGRLLREGAAAFETNDDATALSLFQQAYRLSEEPTILVNIGRVFARMRRHDDAIATFQRYIDRAPQAPERAAIERLLREQQTLRDAAANAARTASEQTQRERADRERAAREQAAREQAERDRAAREARRPGAGPWVLLGVGGAVAASSLIPFFAVREPQLGALRRAHNMECTSVGGGWECVDPDGQLAANYNGAVTGTIAFGVLLGTGLAAATAGAIWAAVGAARAEPRVSVSVDPRGSVVIAGRFGGDR